MLNNRTSSQLAIYVNTMYNAAFHKHIFSGTIEVSKISIPFVSNSIESIKHLFLQFNKKILIGKFSFVQSSCHSIDFILMRNSDNLTISPSTHAFCI